MQETLCIGQWHLSSLQSRHLGVSHSSPNCSTMFLLLWLWKPQREFCHNMFHAKILCQNLGHSSLWNPQISLWFSHCQSLIFVDCSLYMFNVLSCSACCMLSRMWVIFKRFWTIFEAFVPHFHLGYTHYIVLESLLNHPNSFCGGMFKLNAKYDEDSFLYSLSHFECDGHTAHMLTQWHLPLPLTSTVKLSLFTHVHPSPLPLAARLHWCLANHSHYINNALTFSEQTSYISKIN